MKRPYEACTPVAANLGMVIAEEPVVTATVNASAELGCGNTDDPQRACLCKVKSNFLKLADARKQLKERHDKLQCMDCVRAERTASINGDPDREDNGGISIEDATWLCASDATLLCDKTHLANHIGVERTNGSHPFYYNIEKQYLWCSDCKAVIKPPEDGSSNAVKCFLDGMRSFQKQQSDKRSKKSASAEPADSLSSSVADVTITSPSKSTVDDASSRSPPRKQICQASSSSRIPGAKGLSNLGNTCFYNSVMQCMLHTSALYKWQEVVIDKDELHIKPGVVTVNEKKVEVSAAKIPLDSMVLPLVNALMHFLTEFRTGRSPNPGPLFEQIARNAPRFRGWAQQDAHELLRYLLDGIRTEELKRFRAGIERHLGIVGKPEPDQALMIKAILESTDRCYVDSIFAGSLLQVICCQSCKHVSNSLEPFLDLSLPLTYDAIPPPTPRAAPRRESTPNKHQKKKARKEAERNARKSRKVKFSEPSSESTLDAIPADPPANGIIDPIPIPGTGTNLDDIKAIDADASDGESQASDTEFMSTSESDEVVTPASSPEPETNGNAANGSPSYSAVLATPATSMPEVETDTRSLVNSLKQFTAIESLCASNAYECENCCAPYNKKLPAASKNKKTVEATKRYLVYSPPTVLTLHLKRFEQVPSFGNRMRTKKIRGHVEFPHVLDLAPFCSKSGQRMAPGQDKVIYSLYGIVSHSGDLGGGHYVAYVKARKPVVGVLTQFMDAGLTPDRLVTTFEEYRANSAVTQELLKPTMPVEDILKRLDEDSQWYYCSDSHTRTVDVNEIDRVEAYILFYERIL
uniref:ubiquitinyl hydrolase 1 n=1 Tax=Panagrellus redivivus TaxID=6233 RepID=A0A7E4W9I0_PANRE